MDLQTMLHNAVAAGRAEQLKNSPQLLLGEMILKLENVKDKRKQLFIDIMDKRPMGIDSWRGRYDELSITTETFGSYNTEEIEMQFPGMTFYKKKEIGKANPTVQEWIDVLKEAIGKTFTGYKGGDFTMGKGTPVYLAEYGSSSFQIDNEPLDEENWSNYKTVNFIDVEEKDDKVYLITSIED